MKTICLSLVLWEDCKGDTGDENLQNREFLGLILLEKPSWEASEPREFWENRLFTSN